MEEREENVNVSKWQWVLVYFCVGKGRLVGGELCTIDPCSAVFTAGASCEFTVDFGCAFSLLVSLHLAFHLAPSTETFTGTNKQALRYLAFAAPVFIRIHIMSSVSKLHLHLTRSYKV